MPQLLELVLVTQRVHRLPESRMLECAKLIGARDLRQRARFPRRIVSAHVLEGLRLQHEKSTIDPSTVTGRLFLEAGHARVIDEHRTITSGRLDGSQCYQAPMRPMKV